MKRALFAATAAVMLALAMPGAQAAGTDTKAASPHSRADFFERLDANKDGAVTAEEMVVYRHRRFTEIDADGNGTIARDEFMAFSARQKPASAKSSDTKSGDTKASDARKVKYFERLDADKDGTISGTEWDAVATRQFASLDADKDGKVTKAEMTAARERFQHRRGGTGTPAKPGETQAN